MKNGGSNQTDDGKQFTPYTRKSLKLVIFSVICLLTSVFQP